MPSNRILTAAVIGLGELGANVTPPMPAHIKASTRSRRTAANRMPLAETFARAWDTAGASLRVGCRLLRRKKDQLTWCLFRTMDRQHERQTMTARASGYHVLIEKPIAVTEEELGRSLVKRYAATCFGASVMRPPSTSFSTVEKIIDAGTLGDLVSLRSSENMGTWVSAHSLVRGQFSQHATSSHVITQKGCHAFGNTGLVGSPPELISCTASPPPPADRSIGSLTLRLLPVACS